MADKEAYGIMLIKNGISNTESNKNTPCMKAETLVFAPASILAEPLTTTAVMGIAPKSPHRKLPIPCAINSRFTGVILL